MLREDGTLLINGKPVFPVGIRIEGEGKEHARLAGIGFNMLLGSGAVATPDFYREAARNKLWVIAGHYDWASFTTLSRGNKHGVDLYAGDVVGLRKAFGYVNQAGQSPLEALEAVDSFPSVFAWNTCEEPLPKFVEPLNAMYEVFKANSPDHLVITLLTHPDGFSALKHAGDLAMVDVYPYRGKASLPPILSYEYVKRAIRETGKPVWLMPQLYHPSYFSGVPGEDLTLRQMRQAAYLGLIAGAKGIVLYSYYAYEMRLGKDERPLEPLLAERWERLRALVSELTKLGPVICDGRPVEMPVQWAGSDGTALGLAPTRALEYYGKTYLMVANVSGQTVTGSLRNPSRVNPNGYELSVFAGARDVGVTQAPGPDERATVTLAPNGQGVVLLTRRALLPGDDQH